jgi:hypothetical protein
MAQPSAGDLLGKAIIYDGFYMGSEVVEVLVNSSTVGATVFVYDEDSLDLLGSKVRSGSDIFSVPVAPLSSARIIAFVNEWGCDTYGGVEVLASREEPTGWLLPVVDYQNTPTALGDYDETALVSQPMRYDASLRNRAARLYARQVLEYAQSPIYFRLNTVYSFGAGSVRQCTVFVTGVFNAKSSYVVNINGPGVNVNAISATFTVNGNVTVTVTETGGPTRVVSETINVSPTTMPAPPDPVVSTIFMYFYNSYLTSADGYILQMIARCPSQVQFSQNGSTWIDGSLSGANEYSHVFGNVTPGIYTVYARVKSNPTDVISFTAKVPYTGS